MSSFWIKLALSAILLAQVSCTRDEPKEMSSVVIRLPSAPKLSASLGSQSLGSLSLSYWNSAIDPTQNSELNCFGILVSGEDLALQNNSVTRADGSGVIRFGPYVALRPAGSEIRLQVGAGRNRTFYLIGWRATAQSACVDLTSGLDLAELSSPHLIGSQTVDLLQGENSVTIQAGLSGAPILSRFQIDSLRIPQIASTTAVIFDYPGSPSSLSHLAIRVGGVGVSHYQYKLGLNSTIDCTSSNGYSPQTDVATRITDHLTIDQAYKLCVVGTNNTDRQSFLNATSYSWTKSSAATDGAMMLINNGLTATNQALAQLTLAMPGAAEMYITNTAGCASGGGWEAFAAQKTWTLNQTNSTATVYAKFRDHLGFESTCTSDSIVHDNTAPTQPGTIVVGSVALRLDETPTFTFASSTDVVSGVTGYVGQLHRASDNSIVVPYSAFTSGSKLTVQLVHGESYYFVVKAIDAAGNESVIRTSAGFTAVEPRASLSGVPSDPSTATNLNVTVGGTGVTHYKYKFGRVAYTSCADLAGYSVETAVATSINGAIGPDAHYTLCVIGSDGTTYQALASATSYTWQKFIVSQPYVQVSSGYTHSCGLTSNGNAFCWGSGADGELGDGSNVPRAEPVAVVAGANPTGRYKALAAARSFTCGLSTNGKIFCWGSGLSGRLGYGDVVSKLTPYPIADGQNTLGHDYVQVSATQEHVCALTVKGNIYCWGAGGAGRLGNASTANRLVPTAIAAGENTSNAAYVQISAGNQFSCGLISSGKAFCWGLGTYGNLGNGTTVSATSPVAVLTGANAPGIFQRISLGTSFACGLAPRGLVFCWGFGATGRLGNDLTTDQPKPVLALNGQNLTGTPYVDIDLGANHACAVAADGKAYCWGNGAQGQLGDNAAVIKMKPSLVVAGANSDNKKFVSVSGGQLHTCALTASGEIFCWGLASAGRLGHGFLEPTENAPVAVVSGSNTSVANAFTQVVSGSAHSCGLTSEGKVYCWGDGAFGQLGQGSSVDSVSPVAVISGANTDGHPYIRLTGGGNHTCGITSIGRAFCWGYGIGGELGNAISSNANSPVAVSAGANSTNVEYADIAAGNNHTCAISTKGNLYCWGLGTNGRLGHGQTSGSNLPVAVILGQNSAGKTYEIITAGAEHNCAVTSVKTMYCWGKGQGGRLGNGLIVDQTSPVLTQPADGTASTPWIGVTAGSQHTCGLTVRGVAYCWGNGFNGQVGNSTSGSGSASLPTPNLVSAGSNSSSDPYIKISAGGNSTCALTSAGQLYCWGSGSSGQLGNNLTTDASAPVTVALGENSLSLEHKYLSVGTEHACGITSDGEAYCWGANASSQLGDGTTTSRQSPVLVDPVP